MHTSEQLWMLNRAWNREYDFPHYIDLIAPGKTLKEQQESDARELEQVHAFLMGGDIQ